MRLPFLPNNFMIPANKNSVLDALFYRYFRWLIRHSFHTVGVHGLEKLKALPPESPAILFCNHTSYWDGLVAYLVSRAVPNKANYVMMEEKQLKDLQFLTWLGAFSVDLSSPLRSALAVRYALHLLKKPGTALWIFPQGKIVPPMEKIEIHPGADFLARRSDATLVPIAFKYGLFREDRPNILIWVGDPFPAKECSVAKITETCQNSYASAEEAFEKQDLTGFTLLFPPKLSLNKELLWFEFAVTGRLRKFNPSN